jgi:hypothetical protein
MDEGIILFTDFYTQIGTLASDGVFRLAASIVIE